MYNIKILNKDDTAHDFTIKASGVPGIAVSYGSSTVWAGPGQVQGVPVRIRVPQGAITGGVNIRIDIQATDAPALHASGDARFLAPTG